MKEALSKKEKIEEMVEPLLEQIRMRTARIADIIIIECEPEERLHYCDLLGQKLLLDSICYLEQRVQRREKEH